MPYTNKKEKAVHMSSQRLLDVNIRRFFEH
ncbi:hypothetical protein CGLO_13421 [Colletotrichum gloeosporioides Cg-14]|uniref:Uncharacterized protein n=1 Tax=Colletotrichum gloeosporioides (strain Cg-14) TaxID=1237896 RepID=T0K3V5_COLGC|nr:hypothetical protein CGLO_13421 [Colletotrichum gloeosporioides Cg-14]